MIPIDPTPIPSPQPPTARPPFWDYSDLLLFVFLVIASLALSVLIGVLSLAKLSDPFRLFLPQILWYALAFAALKALLLVRYQQPFWRSLGWRPISLSAASGALLAGPLLVISIGLLGSALHMPEIDLPFDQMLGSRGSTYCSVCWW